LQHHCKYKDEANCNQIEHLPFLKQNHNSVIIYKRQKIVKHNVILLHKMLNLGAEISQ
jgi:hypothetical protein